MVKRLEMLEGPILLRSKQHSMSFRSEGVLHCMAYGPTRYNLIWVYNNLVVGAISCTKNTEFETWLTNVYVDSNWRNMKVGRMITEYAVRVMGCNVLTVKANNIPAIKLYRNLGFRYICPSPTGSDVMARDGWIASNIPINHYDTKDPTLEWS